MASGCELWGDAIQSIATRLISQTGELQLKGVCGSISHNQEIAKVESETGSLIPKSMISIPGNLMHS